MCALVSVEDGVFLILIGGWEFHAVLLSGVPDIVPHPGQHQSVDHYVYDGKGEVGRQFEVHDWILTDFSAHG